MTLEETIAKCDERVKILIESMNACDLDDPVEKLLARNDAKGADEHRQLAKWLKELKAVKDLIRQHDEDSMPEDFWYIDKIREVVQE